MCLLPVATAICLLLAASQPVCSRGIAQANPARRRALGPRLALRRRAHTNGTHGQVEVFGEAITFDRQLTKPGGRGSWAAKTPRRRRCRRRVRLRR
jgi:hypothetical protein